jgi:prepilin-type N-terminal cleavage/methylation domain-containing protein
MKRMRGFTLLELLVVILIAITVFSTIVPVIMAQAVQGRQVQYEQTQLLVTQRFVWNLRQDCARARWAETSDGARVLTLYLETRPVAYDLRLDGRLRRMGPDGDESVGPAVTRVAYQLQTGKHPAVLARWEIRADVAGTPAAPRVLQLQASLPTALSPEEWREAQEARP